MADIEFNIPNLIEEIKLNSFMVTMKHMGAESEAINMLEGLLNSFRKNGVPADVIIKSYMEFLNNYEEGDEDGEEEIS